MQIVTDAFGNALCMAFLNSTSFYSDGEASLDLARERLRFSAAQIEANNTTRYRSNNRSTATQRTSLQTPRTASAGSSTSPLGVSTTNVMSNGQPTIANSTPDLQPDGVYVDDNGTRHFRVNISHESRPDPITQFKAAIQDRLDQWGADAVARDDDVSLAIGGALTALNQVVMPDDSVSLAAGLIAGPVVGKGLAWGMRGLEVAASRTAVTSWLAADITKVPGALSQASSGAIDAALKGTKESISELGRTAAEMAENWMINRGGVLKAVEGKTIINEAKNIRPGFLTSAEFAELPKTGTIDPRTILYSQGTAASAFKPPYGSIDDFIQDLRVGKIHPANIDPVRIVQCDGKIFTLDNRRLYSFEQAGIKIPYQKLEKIPETEMFKFTTKNDGTSITIRKGK